MGSIGRSCRAWRCRWPGPGVGDRSTADSHRLRRAGAVQRRRNRPLHRRVVAARRFADVTASIDHPANRRQRCDLALGAVVVQWQRPTSRRRLGRGHRPPRRRSCTVARPGTGRTLDRHLQRPRRWQPQKADPPPIAGKRGRHVDETDRAPAIGTRIVDDRCRDGGRRVGVARRKRQRSRCAGVRVGDGGVGRRSAGWDVRRARSLADPPCTVDFGRGRWCRGVELCRRQHRPPVRRPERVHRRRQRGTAPLQHRPR